MRGRVVSMLSYIHYISYGSYVYELRRERHTFFVVSVEGQTGARLATDAGMHKTIKM